MVWIINRCKANNLGDQCIGHVLTNEIRKRGYQTENIEYLGEDSNSKVVNVFIRVFKKLKLNKISLLFNVMYAFYKRKKPSLLVIGGGQLLLNNDNFLYSLLFWSLLSRIHNLPIVIFSVGTEKRNNYTFFDKIILKIVLKYSKKTYLRDFNTVRIIKGITGVEYETVPDVVILMSKRSDLEKFNVHNTVFVQKYKNINNQLDCRPKNKEEYFEYIYKHIESEITHKDVITYSSYKDKATSIQFSEWISDNKNININVYFPENINDIISIINSSKKIFSTRMHPLIFSKVYGVQFRAIPLNKKIIEMENFLNKHSLSDLIQQTENKLNEIIKLSNEYTIST